MNDFTVNEPSAQPGLAEPRDPHENENRLLKMFSDQMMSLAEKDDDPSKTEARNIASMLIMRANLPLLFRVDAHIVLACGNEDYLYHAREAVRVAEWGRELFGSGKTPEAREAVEDLLDRARETLRRAERDSPELKRINECLKAGTIKRPKKGTRIMYGGIHRKSLYLFQRQASTNSNMF